MVLKELKYLPGFLISRHKLNNISYMDGTMLMVESKRKTERTVRQGNKRKQEERTNY